MVVAAGAELVECPAVGRVTQVRFQGQVRQRVLEERQRLQRRRIVGDLTERGVNSPDRAIRYEPADRLIDRRVFGRMRDAGAVVEAIKRRRARLRPRAPVGGGAGTRTRPAIYVDTAQMVPVLYAVAAILFAFTLLVVYADLVKPITLNS